MIAVLVSAIAVVTECVQHRISHDLVRLWWTGQAGQYSKTLQDYDTNFALASGDRNLAMRFLNLDPNNPEHVKFAQLMFCRGAYALYPRRAWAVPEGTVLNGGKEPIESHFSPPPQWLREHDVRTVIEAAADEHGAIQIRAVPAEPGGGP